MKKYTFDDLLKIQDRLMAKNGCPWDREQTLETLKKYLLEECYEVLEAIETKDYNELRKELGDVLYQIIFESKIASLQKKFTIYDVIDGLCRKMITRHPHVFGTKDLKTAKEVKKNWEKEKKKEGVKSVLKGIPKNMPALARSFRITERAATVGFDWTNYKDIFLKMEEERIELLDAIKKKNNKEIEHELGDLIFAIANLARHLEIDPEGALRKTMMRFESRFNYIERKLKRQKIDIHDASLELMEKYWQESKKSGKR